MIWNFTCSVFSSVDLEIRAIISFKVISVKKIIYLRAIEAMWPVAHERKSPVDKAAKVGVQVPAKAHFLLCFFFDCLFTM